MVDQEHAERAEAQRLADELVGLRVNSRICYELTAVAGATQTCAAVFATTTATNTTTS